MLTFLRSDIKRTNSPFTLCDKMESSLCCVESAGEEVRSGGMEYTVLMYTSTLTHTCPPQLQQISFELQTTLQKHIS